jgi:dTDP-4-dehydrorhamnose reductase
MKVLVTGASGLLARALHKRLPAGVQLVALGHKDFDLTRSQEMENRLSILQPDVVINTAAYNAVDHCEVERELSWAVNAEGPKQLAQLCGRLKVRLVHYSTDYVFDGDRQVPYVEADTPNPVNHYAAGKLAGEQAVLVASPEHLVLRVSWLFGQNPDQPRSFVHAVMRQAMQGKPLRATIDQSSTPTWVEDLADWTYRLVAMRTHGMLHAVNDEGVSRLDWCRAIVAEAVACGLLKGLPDVKGVTTGEMTPGIKRPRYTVLDNGKATKLLGHPLGSWRKGLAALLREPFWQQQREAL